MVTFKNLLYLLPQFEFNGRLYVPVEDLKDVFLKNHFDDDLSKYFWDWLMIQVVKKKNQVSMNDLLLLKRQYEGKE